MRWLGARWLLILVVLLAFGPVAAAAPPPRNPGDSNGTEEKTDSEPSRAVEGFDLPSLTITPSDIDEPGYGVSNGKTTSVADDAALINSLLGGADDEAPGIQAQLEEAGWRQSYWLTFAIPSGDDPSLYGTMITNSLTEYADEDGAGIGYDLLREGNAAFGLLRISDAVDIGDESVVTRMATTSSDGRPLNYLDVVFRVGSVVAEIYISEYSDARPTVETIVALAEAVAGRLADTEPPAEPGLSQRTLFITGTGVRTTFNYYNRLAGEQISPYGYTPAQTRSDDRFYRDAGVTDIYTVAQSKELAGPDDGNLSYLLDVYRFNDEDDAAAALDEWSANWIDTPASGYEKVKAVRGAGVVADESTLLSHTFVTADGVDLVGFRVLFQAADVVVSLIMHAPPGIDQDAFVDVANVAADCVAATEPCAPLRVKEETLTGR